MRNFIKDCMLFQSKDKYNRWVGTCVWLAILAIISTLTLEILAITKYLNE